MRARARCACGGRRPQTCSSLGVAELRLAKIRVSGALTTLVPVSSRARGGGLAPSSSDHVLTPVSAWAMNFSMMGSKSGGFTFLRRTLYAEWPLAEKTRARLVRDIRHRAHDGCGRACRPSSTDRNNRTASSVAAGLSGSRAIGSPCSGCLAQPLQPIIDIEKPWLPPHAFAPNPSNPMESEMLPIDQVFRTV